MSDQMVPCCRPECRKIMRAEDGAFCSQECERIEEVRAWLLGG